MGSLRHVSKSLDLLPGHCISGGRIRELLKLYFTDKLHLIDALCDSLGKESSIDELLPPADVAGLRAQVLQLIRNNHDVPALKQLDDNVDLQAELLHAWASWAADPAAHTSR